MIALTFDTDYLSAEDLERFVDEFPIPGRGTFFLWKPYAGLSLGDHELGIHPYFQDRVPWNETLDEFIGALGSRTTSCRAHSCAYSHMLGIALAKRGFSVVSQATYLFRSGLTAYRQPWGLWELPIYYMESMDFTFSHNWPDLAHEAFDPRLIARSLGEPGLFVYDFHPLHVILNTSSYAQYQAVREELVSGRRSAFETRFAGRGARDFYLELVEQMDAQGQESVACCEVPLAACWESAESNSALPNISRWPTIAAARM